MAHNFPPVRMSAFNRRSLDGLESPSFMTVSRCDGFTHLFGPPASMDTSAIPGTDARHLDGLLTCSDCGVSCACYVKWPPGTYSAGSNICPIHAKMNVPLDVSALLDETIVDFPLSVASPAQSSLAGPSTSTEENGSGGLEGNDFGRDDVPTSLVGGDISVDLEEIMKSFEPQAEWSLADFGLLPAGSPLPISSVDEVDGLAPSAGPLAPGVGQSSTSTAETNPPTLPDFAASVLERLLSTENISPDVERAFEELMAKTSVSSTSDTYPEYHGTSPLHDSGTAAGSLGVTLHPGSALIVEPKQLPVASPSQSDQEHRAERDSSPERGFTTGECYADATNPSGPSSRSNEAAEPTAEDLPDPSTSSVAVEEPVHLPDSALPYHDQSTCPFFSTPRLLKEADLMFSDAIEKEMTPPIRGFLRKWGDLLFSRYMMDVTMWERVVGGPMIEPE